MRIGVSGAWTIGAGLAVLAGGALAQETPGGFPDGPDRALVQTTCTGCHVGAQVTSQRKTNEEWASTVDQMIGYGAPISDADYPKIVTYLTAKFGPEK